MTMTYAQTYILQGMEEDLDRKVSIRLAQNYPELYTENWSETQEAIIDQGMRAVERTVDHFTDSGLAKIDHLIGEQRYKAMWELFESRSRFTWTCLDTAVPTLIRTARAIGR